MPRAANPRPRKYASAAERQAAYRNRWATLEVRTTPEQATTIESIARERDISRNELVYQMMQFALTNHNWRAPTFRARLPSMADVTPSGDLFIETGYDRDKRVWVSFLRNAQMEIIAKPLETEKRPSGLTWESFEAFP